MDIRRVIVIGGAGAMGRHSSRLLASFDFVEELVIAGLDSPTTRKFVASLGPRARFESIDIMNESALRAAIASVDAVVNTAGPFFVLGKRVAEAALAERKPYLDICDDPEPTEDILDLNDAAKKAGITMIVGLGLSPGISNVLAVAAANELDHVEKLDTTWDVAATLTVDDGYMAPIDPSRVSAAAVHGMHMCSTDASWLEGGKWVKAMPMEPHRLELPDDRSFTGWSVAHPESVSMPRTYSTLTQSRNLMTGPDNIFGGMQRYRDRIRSGEITSEGAAAEMSSRMKSGAISREVESGIIEERDASAPRVPPCFCAIAYGTKDGKATHAAAWINRLPAGGMGAGTGIPVALGVQLLHEGKITKSGAFAPEGAIDPIDFFELYEKYCTKGDRKHPLIETIVSQTRK